LDGDQRRRYREYLDAELEAAAIYGALAGSEPDSGRAEVFGKLVEAEMRHAARWAEKLGIEVDSLRSKRRGPKVWLVARFARVFGTAKVVPLLMRGEDRDIDLYEADPEAQDLVKEERHHSLLLRRMGEDLRRPRDVAAVRSGVGGGGGSARAAVLGVNDGLVSNFSLVAGVAGGTGNPDFVLLAGVAGLLAGAFSMAAGEYVSVRSQRDIFEHQIQKERIELQEFPEEEEEELVLIYQAKGLTQDESRRIAQRVMVDDEVALDTMAREELGLDPSQLGSPWKASLSSFSAFVGGAAVPILPYVLGAGSGAFSLSATLSGLALAAVGGTMAFLSGRAVTWGALRMLMAGGAAAAVTFGIGSLIGVSV
jgi:VIT1/CCC1 family predicted Fe2+/Mn2+ transporter